MLHKGFESSADSLLTLYSSWIESLEEGVLLFTIRYATRYLLSGKSLRIHGSINSTVSAVFHRTPSVVLGIALSMVLYNGVC